MALSAFVFVAIVVVAIALFVGVVYLIVRFVNRGDSIAVEPGTLPDGSDPQPRPPA